MRQKVHCCLALIAAGLMMAWPSTAGAQLGGLPGLVTPTAKSTASTIVGEGSAVQATIFGLPTPLGTLGTTTTTLADTGTLSTVNNALDASLGTGSVAGLITAETLSAGTISWPNQVDSYASVGNLNVKLAGVTIYADEALAEASTAASGSASYLSNLTVNGTPITVSGAPNQTISIPGGQVVINEQTVSSTGAKVVNALHVTVGGVADVVIASATAGIQ